MLALPFFKTAAADAGDDRLLLLKGDREHVSLAFLTKKSSHCALVRGWLERVDKIAKALGENVRPQFPILSDARRDDVMPEESVPAFEKLFVH